MEKKGDRNFAESSVSSVFGENYGKAPTRSHFKMADTHWCK
jgi:hypothetical protein